MKHPLLILIASLVALGTPAQAQHSHRKHNPRLVVGIVVDGLEEEYVELLRQHFRAGGFNRMLNDGVSIPDVDFGTSLDCTAATALLYTGAAPSVNGIPADEVFDRQAYRPMPIFNDPDIIGNYTLQTLSPKALNVTTISDEVRLAGAGVTYAYAIAAEPSKALIMAGHAGNCGIWLNDLTGNWATTTYYKDVPTMLQMRNRTQQLKLRMDTMQWTPLYSAESYWMLPEHIRRYPFRYVFRPADGERIDMLKNSPKINTEVTSWAIDHLKTLQLGQHDGVDMLSINYTLEPYAYSKATDNRFEFIDSYYRLDAELERLFNAIESQVGLRDAVIFVAGTPRPPRSRRSDEKWSLPYGEFSTKKAISLLNMYLIAIHGNGDWVQGFHNNEIFLNHRLIHDRNINLQDIRVEAADFMTRMSGVTEVYTVDDLVNGRAGVNAHAERRNVDVTHAGDLRITVSPGWQIVDDYNAPGELPNQVVRATAPTAPVYILAPTVEPQVISTTVDARVIAPTICRLLRIRSPNGASLPPLKF